MSFILLWYIQAQCQTTGLHETKDLCDIIIPVYCSKDGSKSGTHLRHSRYQYLNNKKFSFLVHVDIKVLAMQKILIISGKPAEADKKVPPSSLYLVGIFDLLWILKPCYRRNFHSRASIEILFSFEKTPDTSSCPNNCKLKYFTNKLNVGTNIVHLSQIFSELMQKRINIFF